jgi:glycosyltransferase involved in cell wall biosynthesis
LLPASLRPLPTVCYFHENQLTYPLSPDDWRDYQYGFSNITSALAADAVWFNSASHRAAFLAAAGELLRQMPDAIPGDVVDTIRGKSTVQYPAVAAPAGGALRELPGSSDSGGPDRPVRILWCHRWEFDKDPEAFFGVLSRLKAAGAVFELVLVGEQFRQAPEVFRTGLAELADHVVHAGYVPNRAEYERLVSTCDVVVSTAIQENFGIATVEAMLAGCWPLLPNRLSYPEVLPPWTYPACLYDTDVELFDRLRKLCATKRESWHFDRRKLATEFQARFGLPGQAQRLDDALSAVATTAW